MGAKCDGVGILLLGAEESTHAKMIYIVRPGNNPKHELSTPQKRVGFEIMNLAVYAGAFSTSWCMRLSLG